MYNTRFIIVGLIAIVLIGGGISFTVLGKNKKIPTVPEVAQDTAVNNSQTTSEPETTETCAPRNTPTCGPDGKPLTANVPGQTANVGTSASTSVKSLSSVSIAKVQLTGAGTEGLDIDKKTGYVYALNNGAIISGCKGDVTQTGGRQEVVKGASTLSIVDPTAGKEIVNVATEQAPIWPLVDTERNVVYAAGSGNGKVAIHELGTGKKIESMTIGGRPHAFGLSPSGILIASNTNDSTQTYMSAISAATRKLISHHKAPEFPHGIVYDAANDVFYLVGVKQGDIAIVDGKTGEIKGTMTLTEKFNNSNMLAFSPKTRQLFVSDTQQTSAVTVVNVDTQKIVGHIGWSQTSWPAWGMEVDDANGLLYAALPNGNVVGVADVKSLKPLATIPVDECPYAVRLDTAKGKGYTTGQVNATLSIFDLATVKAALGK